jgi:predicted TIM-barrel fold metal-dependent hydrolase
VIEPERYVVISSDGHCGANLLDYRPYLESRFHDEFDQWATSFHDGWIDAMGETLRDANKRIGQASYEAPLNWDSQHRLRLMEEQGVVAEVLFPNTIPPFYPSNILTAPGPRTLEEYEYRWAGIRAHNRWLADFCADVPGRRAGMAQLFLDKIEDAVAEVQWAREAGLMGVLLPADHVLKLVNLYYPELDAVWAVCSDLDMAVVKHDVWCTESEDVGGVGIFLAGTFENNFYTLRQVGHLIAAGVFERFPNLKLAITEMRNSADVPMWLAKMDAVVEEAHRRPNRHVGITRAVRMLSRKPSEYFETNLFIAAPMDLFAGLANNAPNIMFGVDLPHAEGTWPYTNEVLRLILGDLSEQERRQFLYERQADLYGFNLDLLEKHAARVGPIITEVTTPLPLEDRPRYPEDTRCGLLRHSPA